MKKVLVDIYGNISDVVEAGDEFEIYEGADATCIWMDVPADVVISKSIMVVNGSFVERLDSRDTIEGRNLARKVSYGDIGTQLDMIYKDELNGTTIWKDHIANIKATVPAPSEGTEATGVEPTPREEPQWLKL
tara:strand:- start:1156 stop:1554 length:399 start_codon:yes stop_codon:yes gene_type:complete